MTFSGSLYVLNLIFLSHLSPCLFSSNYHTSILLSFPFHFFPVSDFSSTNTLFIFTRLPLLLPSAFRLLDFRSFSYLFLPVGFLVFRYHYSAFVLATFITPRSELIVFILFLPPTIPVPCFTRLCYHLPSKQSFLQSVTPLLPPFTKTCSPSFWPASMLISIFFSSYSPAFLLFSYDLSPMVISTAILFYFLLSCSSLSYPSTFFHPHSSA